VAGWLGSRWEIFPIRPTTNLQADINFIFKVETALQLVNHGPVDTWPNSD